MPALVWQVAAWLGAARQGSEVRRTLKHIGPLFSLRASAGRASAWPGETWRGGARPDRARQGSGDRTCTGHNYFAASHGLARSGEARPGTARHGEARPGKGRVTGQVQVTTN